MGFFHFFKSSQTRENASSRPYLVSYTTGHFLFFTFDVSFFYCSKLTCILLSYSFHVYSKRGFDVRSFGTGSHVKLPGPTPDKPNVYDFKTTYVQMYNDLVRKDKELYPLLTHLSTHAHAHTCFASKTGSQSSIHGPCFYRQESFLELMQCGDFGQHNRWDCIVR